MHNIVYREELSAAGVSSDIIKAALECCLLRLCRGVYSVLRDCQVGSHRRIASFIEDPDWIELHTEKPETELNADFDYKHKLRTIRIRTYRWYRPDDVISGTSAAVLHGMPLYKDKSVAITVRHPTSSSSSKELVRVRTDLPAEDQVQMDHLTVTSPVRTGFDLIRKRGQRDAFAALEWVLRQATIKRFPGFNPKFGYPQDFIDDARQVVEEEFLPVIARMKSGQVTAQRMTEALSPLSESIAESFCHFNLRALKISGFTQQIEVYDRRGFITRVDFLHEEARTVLAVDGSQKYALVGPSLLRREGEQHNRLLGLGYRVVHLDFQELLHLSKFSAKVFAQSPELKRFAGAHGQ
jgi:hypothetical protein